MAAIPEPVESRLISDPQNQLELCFDHGWKRLQSQLGNGVVATGMERVAAKDPPESKPAST